MFISPVRRPASLSCPSSGESVGGPLTGGGGRSPFSSPSWAAFERAAASSRGLLSDPLAMTPSPLPSTRSTRTFDEEEEPNTAPLASHSRLHAAAAAHLASNDELDDEDDTQFFTYAFGVVRGLSSSFEEAGDGASSSDSTLAEQQHAQYLRTLRDLLPGLLELPADARRPACAFVETDAFAVGRALVTASDPDQAAASEEADPEPGRSLRSLGFESAFAIAPPARLDGSDVLWTGRHLFVGVATGNDYDEEEEEEVGGTNAAAVSQLASLLPALPVRALPLPVPGARLKSLVGLLACDTLVVSSDATGAELERAVQLVDPSYTFVRVSDPRATHLLRLGRTVLIPHDLEASSRRVLSGAAEKRGLVLQEVDVTELLKVSSSAMTSSILLLRDLAPPNQMRKPPSQEELKEHALIEAQAAALERMLREGTIGGGVGNPTTTTAATDSCPSHLVDSVASRVERDLERVSHQLADRDTLIGRLREELARMEERARRAEAERDAALDDAKRARQDLADHLQTHREASTATPISPTRTRSTSSPTRTRSPSRLAPPSPASAEWRQELAQMKKRLKLDDSSATTSSVTAPSPISASPTTQNRARARDASPKSARLSRSVSRTRASPVSETEEEEPKKQKQRRPSSSPSPKSSPTADSATIASLRAEKVALEDRCAAQIEQLAALEAQHTEAREQLALAASRTAARRVAEEKEREREREREHERELARERSAYRTTSSPASPTLSSSASTSFNNNSTTAARSSAKKKKNLASSTAVSSPTTRSRAGTANGSAILSPRGAAARSAPSSPTRATPRHRTSLSGVASPSSSTAATGSASVTGTPLLGARSIDAPLDGPSRRTFLQQSHELFLLRTTLADAEEATRLAQQEANAVRAELETTIRHNDHLLTEIEALHAEAAAEASQASRGGSGIDLTQIASEHARLRDDIATQQRTVLTQEEQLKAYRVKASSYESSTTQLEDTVRRLRARADEAHRKWTDAQSTCAQLLAVQVAQAHEHAELVAGVKHLQKAVAGTLDLLSPTASTASSSLLSPTAAIRSPTAVVMPPKDDLANSRGQLEYVERAHEALRERVAELESELDTISLRAPPPAVPASRAAAFDQTPRGGGRGGGLEQTPRRKASDQGVARFEPVASEHDLSALFPQIPHASPDARNGRRRRGDEDSSDFDESDDDDHRDEDASVAASAAGFPIFAPLVDNAALSQSGSPVCSPPSIDAALAAEKANLEVENRRLTSELSKAQAQVVRLDHDLVDLRASLQAESLKHTESRNATQVANERATRLARDLERAQALTRGLEEDVAKLEAALSSARQEGYMHQLEADQRSQDERNRMAQIELEMRELADAMQRRADGGEDEDITKLPAFKTAAKSDADPTRATAIAPGLSPVPSIDELAAYASPSRPSPVASPTTGTGPVKMGSPSAGLLTPHTSRIRDLYRREVTRLRDDLDALRRANRDEADVAAAAAVEAASEAKSKVDTATPSETTTSITLAPIVENGASTAEVGVTTPSKPKVQSSPSLPSLFVVSPGAAAGSSPTSPVAAPPLPPLPSPSADDSLPTSQLRPLLRRLRRESAELGMEKLILQSQLLALSEASKRKESSWLLERREQDQALLDARTRAEQAQSEADARTQEVYTLRLRASLQEQQLKLATESQTHLSSSRPSTALIPVFEQQHEHDDLDSEFDPADPYATPSPAASPPVPHALESRRGSSREEHAQALSTLGASLDALDATNQSLRADLTTASTTRIALEASVRVAQERVTSVEEALSARTEALERAESQARHLDARLIQSSTERTEETREWNEERRSLLDQVSHLEQALGTQEAIVEELRRRLTAAAAAETDGDTWPPIDDDETLASRDLYAASSPEGQDLFDSLDSGLLTAEEAVAARQRLAALQHTTRQRLARRERPPTEDGPDAELGFVPFAELVRSQSPTRARSPTRPRSPGPPSAAGVGPSNPSPSPRHRHHHRSTRSASSSRAASPSPRRATRRTRDGSREFSFGSAGSGSLLYAHAAREQQVAQLQARLASVEEDLERASSLLASERRAAGASEEAANARIADLLEKAAYCAVHHDTSHVVATVAAVESHEHFRASIAQLEAEFAEAIQVEMTHHEQARLASEERHRAAEHRAKAERIELAAGIQARDEELTRLREALEAATVAATAVAQTPQVHPANANASTNASTTTTPNPIANGKDVSLLGPVASYSSRAFAGVRPNSFLVRSPLAAALLASPTGQEVLRAHQQARGGSGDFDASSNGLVSTSDASIASILASAPSATRAHFAPLIQALQRDRRLLEQTILEHVATLAALERHLLKVERRSARIEREAKKAGLALEEDEDEEEGLTPAFSPEEATFSEDANDALDRSSSSRLREWPLTTTNARAQAALTGPLTTADLELGTPVPSARQGPASSTSSAANNTHTTATPARNTTTNDHTVIAPTARRTNGALHTPGTATMTPHPDATPNASARPQPLSYLQQTLLKVQVRPRTKTPARSPRASAGINVTATTTGVAPIHSTSSAAASRSASLRGSRATSPLRASHLATLSPPRSTALVESHPDVVSASPASSNASGTTTVTIVEVTEVTTEVTTTEETFSSSSSSSTTRHDSMSRGQIMESSPPSSKASFSASSVPAGLLPTTAARSFAATLSPLRPVGPWNDSASSAGGSTPSTPLTPSVIAPALLPLGGVRAGRNGPRPPLPVKRRPSFFAQPNSPPPPPDVDGIAPANPVIRRHSVLQATHSHSASK